MSHDSDRTGGRRISPRVAILAVLLVAAAGMHLGLAPTHARESAAAGAFFVLASVAQLVLAVAVVARPLPWVLRTTAAVNGALVVLWAISRVVVVPLSGHASPEAATITGATVVALEVAAVAVGLLLLRSGVRSPRRRLRRSPAFIAAAVALFGVSAPAAATVADATGHGAEHSVEHSVERDGGLDWHGDDDHHG